MKSDAFGTRRCRSATVAFGGTSRERSGWLGSLRLLRVTFIAHTSAERGGRRGEARRGEARRGSERRGPPVLRHGLSRGLSAARVSRPTRTHLESCEPLVDVGHCLGGPLVSVDTEDVQ